VGHPGTDLDLLCHGYNKTCRWRVQYASAMRHHNFRSTIPAKRTAATENISIPGLSYSIGSAAALCIRNPS
jgi:hypothetical protein